MSGCDTTGHIHEKNKIAWQIAFRTARTNVICALCALVFMDEPSEQLLTECEELVCHPFGTKQIKYTQAKELLKANQGTKKLPPTQGAFYQHIMKAHLQRIIRQLVLNARPCTLEATTLGWSCESNGEIMALFPRIPPVPKQVVQLVKYLQGAVLVESNELNALS